MPGPWRVERKARTNDPTTAAARPCFQLSAVQRDPFAQSDQPSLGAVAGTGLLAGVLAVPAGIAVHRYVIPAMAGAAGLGVPASLENVYGAGELAALALAGLVIALAGGLLPAVWAARSRTVSALRTE